jgi:hypothetical protein
MISICTYLLTGVLPSFMPILFLHRTILCIPITESKFQRPVSGILSFHPVISPDSKIRHNSPCVQVGQISAPVFFLSSFNLQTLTYETFEIELLLSHSSQWKTRFTFKNQGVFCTLIIRETVLRSWCQRISAESVTETIFYICKIEDTSCYKVHYPFLY